MKTVLQWGETHRRELPWRRTRDPWRILVSEVMLQQTQAGRVVEPYERFLALFPNPAACAAAGPGEVIRAWHGLGYNRRGLNLHRCAVEICQHHGGRVPADLEDLLALPGVGPYTARAVLTFAYEADVGVVDTNVARLLARAVAGRPLGRTAAQRLADGFVPTGDSWAWNQALFDLGAAHCRSARPLCSSCPLRRRCVWVNEGQTQPDPALGPGGRSRRQSVFEGSDRQGRGRLVAELRRAAIGRDRLAVAAGWPDDPGRADAVAGTLVADGLARWVAGRLTLV